MAKAYVNDICQFLDVTNKENVRILKNKTLIWPKPSENMFWVEYINIYYHDVEEDDVVLTLRLLRSCPVSGR